jgi:hypothetical protein
MKVLVMKETQKMGILSLLKKKHYLQIEMQQNICKSKSNIAVIVVEKGMYKLSVGICILAIFVVLPIMIITHVGKDKCQNLTYR